MQVKTITTAAGVNEIDFGNDNSQSTAHFYWLKNLGASTLYVSANPNPVAEKDDVAELPAKGAVSVETDEGKIYVLGAGKVEIHRTNSKFCPFDWQSSGSDITASGNPVQLDGLQDDAPFSEIVVSGKNLMPFPYKFTNVNAHGVDFSVDENGVITANGTIDDYNQTTFIIFDTGDFYLQPGTYTISGLPNPESITSAGGIVIGFDDGTGITYNQKGGKLTFNLSEMKKITVIFIRWYTSGTVFDNVVFNPQLELGSTATAYEPPITGRELTVNASGKNLILTKYTPKSDHINSTIDENGVVTVSTTNPFVGNNTPVSENIETLIPISVLNRDCTVGITWVDGFWRNSDTNSGWLGVKITFYDKNKETISGTTKYKSTPNGVRGLNKIVTISNETIEIPESACYFSINFWISASTYLTDFKYALQLEYGSEATEYEPYHGSTTTITPTSNPYTIPNDVRQQDGYNVVSVSEGELSVVGVQKNAAIKRIWDDMGMDLLFDGLALLASPAENIDLGNYSKYLINCYYDPNAVSKGHCISIVVEYDRLKNIVDKAGALIHSLATSYTLELHFSGIMDNANYYAKQANAESAAYYTRIYGIK